jgi:hypothetical protein
MGARTGALVGAYRPTGFPLPTPSSATIISLTLPIGLAVAVATSSGVGAARLNRKWTISTEGRQLDRLVE